MEISRFVDTIAEVAAHLILWIFMKIFNNTGCSNKLKATPLENNQLLVTHFVATPRVVDHPVLPFDQKDITAIGCQVKSTAKSK